MRQGIKKNAFLLQKYVMHVYKIEIDTLNKIRHAESEQNQYNK